MFIPLLKVDAVQRLVYGCIDETPDRSKEVFDYETSKQHFMTWSQDMQKASDGKSYGNVRAMHSLVAAGKLESIDFDDLNKRIEFCARIVDDNEWQKVEEGVYTGFSPGGKYLKRWKENGVTRYTARPTELSIVDLPCIPTATFTLVKAAGVEEARPFKALAGDDLRKSLYQVGQMSSLLDSLTWIGQSAAMEAQAEKDGSPIPGRLRDWLSTGVAILTDMAREEASEALAGLAAVVGEIPAPVTDMALGAGMGAAAGDDLHKAGARHSSKDLERLQNIHDHAVSMGASCSGSADKAAQTDDLAKAADDLAKAQMALTGAQDELAKIQTSLKSTEEELAKAAGERDELKKRVSELEALPQPGGPRLRAVDKGADVAPRSAAPASADEGPKTYREAMDLAKAMPPGKAKADALRKAAALPDA